jgi:hypothetical protein
VAPAAVVAAGATPPTLPDTSTRELAVSTTVQSAPQATAAASAKQQQHIQNIMQQ